MKRVPNNLKEKKYSYCIGDEVRAWTSQEYDTLAKSSLNMVASIDKEITRPETEIMLDTRIQ